MELLINVGIPRVTSSETPNEGTKDEESWAVCTGGYKDGQGEGMVSRKGGEKERKGEAKETLTAFLGCLLSSPASEQQCLGWDQQAEII